MLDDGWILLNRRRSAYWPQSAGVTCDPTGVAGTTPPLNRESFSPPMPLFNGPFQYQIDPYTDDVQYDPYRQLNAPGSPVSTVENSPYSYGLPSPLEQNGPPSSESTASKSSETPYPVSLDGSIYPSLHVEGPPAATYTITDRDNSWRSDYGYSDLSSTMSQFAQNLQDPGSGVMLGSLESQYGMAPKYGGSEILPCVLFNHRDTTSILN